MAFLISRKDNDFDLDSNGELKYSRGGIVNSSETAEKFLKGIDLEDERFVDIFSVARIGNPIMTSLIIYHGDCKKRTYPYAITCKKLGKKYESKYGGTLDPKKTWLLTLCDSGNSSKKTKLFVGEKEQFAEWFWTVLEKLL